MRLTRTSPCSRQNSPRDTSNPQAEPNGQPRYCTTRNDTSPARSRARSTNRMTDTVLTQSLTLAAESGEVHRSLLQYILKGGPIGMIIILISLVAIGMIGAQLFRIRRERLAPPDLLADLRSLLGDGNIDGAIKRSSDEPGSSYLARVVGTGLTRASRSAFGMLELRSSVDEIGQLEVDRLYRLTDGIGLIASVAPMLGLLGTVVGMVGAFDAITLSDGPARPDELAGSISQALITTVLGLIVAIPCTAMYTFLRNRIDHLTTEIDEQIEEIISPLEAAGGSEAANQ
ncbi:MAG: peptide transporter TolQ [Phycisphaerae bacterium]|nr:peptide transporter TolQ [Phycisphaerae bacterium]MBM91559.1 peptide transporter TolQ [Phycisphaerae bacterium]